MIYTVTFNPSLDYFVTVKDFQIGKTNRTESEVILPGGKGINISIVLGNLGLESTALGFVAGFTGEELICRMEAMGVRADFIKAEQGFTRINLKVKNMEGTEINGCGPVIGDEKLKELMDRLATLQRGDVLFLAGSIPPSLPKDIYGRILAELERRGVLTVVDATGALLLEVLQYKPFLVKPNQQELGELFGVSIKSRQEAVPFGKRLQELGAQNVLISMAGEGAVLLAADGQIWEAPAPEGVLVNGVGAGDSMVAGFMAGWLEQKDYAHAFRMGVAAGSASAFSEELATKAEVEAVYRRVEGLQR